MLFGCVFLVIVFKLLCVLFLGLRLLMEDCYLGNELIGVKCGLFWIFLVDELLIYFLICDWLLLFKGLEYFVLSLESR